MGADDISKTTVTATAVPALEEERPHIDDAAHVETQTVKPNKDIVAAIWAIVCGVALPCIPVIVVSAVLLYFIFHHRIIPRPGWPELHIDPPHASHTKTVAQHVQNIRHQGGDWAYYVHYNPTTITTIAAWTGRIIPYLSSSIMALVGFFAARKIVMKSRRSADGQDLPSPEQLTLLINLLGGNNFGPLKDTLLHRFRAKRPLIDPIPLAACALFLVTSIALLIPIVDTWFGIATTVDTITQLYNHTDNKANHTFGRELSSSCYGGKPGYFGGYGVVWIGCNVDYEGGVAEPSFVDPSLSQPAEITKLAQGLSTTNTIANYTSHNGTQYFYLGDPGVTNRLDFKTSTLGLSATCKPISRKCFPPPKAGETDPWQVVGKTGPAPLNQTYFNFTCSPGFEANMTFNGAAQTIDALQTEGGTDALFGTPMVGIAFSPDAELSERVGQYNASLAEVWKQIDNAYLSSSTMTSGYDGPSVSYSYVKPQNPLHFGAWGTGFPAYDALLVDEDGEVTGLLADPEIFVMKGDSTSAVGWVLGCSVEVYDISYTWSNGSIHTFTPTLASDDWGGLVSSAFGIGLAPAPVSLITSSFAAGAATSAQGLADAFADGWSKSALAMTIGAMQPKLNDIEQRRDNSMTVARVPIVPLYLLLGLKAIYVVAVVMLAIGAYCFTHPAETEVVKAQLSAKGLAAAHFNTPGLVQQNVVKEISNRIQAAKEGKGGDPAPGDVKRASTAPAATGGESEKKVGLVATATGAWTFAVVADGVWNSIKPIAVNLVDLEAKDGNLGEAGDLINAWKG